MVEVLLASFCVREMAQIAIVVVEREVRAPELAGKLEGKTGLPGTGTARDAYNDDGIAPFAWMIYIRHRADLS
jgi:hypothetical protein